MGCGSSTGSKEEKKKNQEINNELKGQKKQLDSIIKLLLLGAGESGKSTIAKQMKIIHLDGFSEEERLSYKAIIFSNLMGSVRALIGACETMGLAIQDRHAVEVIQNADITSISDELAQSIKIVWREEAVQTAFTRQNQFQLNDSAAYYLEQMDRIKDSKFVPNDQDVLRSRAKTTGIIETPFTMNNTKFLMVDVGGQRSERKKWMHCFQEVTAVIFVTALSEYDLKLYEDDITNRMAESLKLFSDICNSKWFTSTAMILFLNKRDLFEEKIQKIDLSLTFPEYNGGKDYEKAVAFIREKFIACNQNQKKHIYHHVTCATDTQNVKVVFEAVKDIILHQVLDETF